MRTVARQFPVPGADTSRRYAAESGYTFGAIAPQGLGPPRVSRTVRYSTVHLIRVFGDGQGATDVRERLTFAHRDFRFKQFAENLFDRVTKTRHAALLSVRTSQRI